MLIFLLELDLQKLSNEESGFNSKPAKLNIVRCYVYVAGSLIYVLSNGADRPSEACTYTGDMCNGRRVLDSAALLFPPLLRG